MPNQLPTQYKRPSLRKTSAESSLDKALSGVLPSLGRNEINVVKARVLEYIAKGIEEGYNVALIKSEGDSRNEQIRIKVLNLLTKDNNAKALSLISTEQRNKIKPRRLTSQKRHGQ